LECLAGYDLSSVHRTRVATAAGCRPIGSGIPASPGVAVGEAVFDAQAAMQRAEAGRSAILIRTDIATTDVAGLAAAAGVLTSRGGRTSHAAVVARQLSKVCIVGCRELVVPEHGNRCRLANQVIEEGTEVALDGNTGRVYQGKLEVVVEKPTHYLEEVERWQARLTKEPALPC
jgi:pyruvate,orthophosphate dikinase